MHLLRLILCGLAAGTSQAAEPAIDASFPGGNVVVKPGSGAGTVFLAPDQRDSSLPWFYWHFRVRGAERGRTLAFAFEKATQIGARGPAVSRDGGLTWSWLGAEAVDAQGRFSWTFGGEAEVRFSVTMPYTRGDWDRFLEGHLAHPALVTGTLATSRKGRQVPLVRVEGRAPERNRFAVAIAARHHCCETMASRVLEGLLEGALADDDAGRWLREGADFFFAPFMDVDGVEEGDQGKNRAPHDHNRDYATEPPRYPEVAALKEALPAWSAGRPLLFLDLHDPALRSDLHETIHFLEPEERDMAARLDRLCTLLERDQQGTLLYRKRHNLAFGKGYNTHAEKPSPLSAGWVRSLPGTLLACTLEIPYANAAGCEVNAESAREFGRDLAAAIQAYLAELSGP